jgi:sulfhydrogenase subunit gamma (sulfur reductase)
MMLPSIIGTAREESVYLPVMARLLKVEPLTELETLFTVQLPGGRRLGHEPGQFVECSVMGIGWAGLYICPDQVRGGGPIMGGEGRPEAV